MNVNRDTTFRVYRLDNRNKRSAGSWVAARNRDEADEFFVSQGRATKTANITLHQDVTAELLCHGGQGEGGQLASLLNSLEEPMLLCLKLPEQSDPLGLFSGGTVTRKPSVWEAYRIR